jgi:hypothetical protein
MSKSSERCKSPDEPCRARQLEHRVFLARSLRPGHAEYGECGSGEIEARPGVLVGSAKHVPVVSRVPALSQSSSTYFVRSLLIPGYLRTDRSDLTRAKMGTLKAAIDALKTVSIVCGMVPLIGENLQSAAELASTICEQIQVRSKHFLRRRVAIS